VELENEENEMTRIEYLIEQTKIGGMQCCNCWWWSPDSPEGSLGFCEEARPPDGELPEVSRYRRCARFLRNPHSEGLPG
jgi:hypothetical protein